MGIFDSLLGLGTNKNTLKASRAMNGQIWDATDLNNRLIGDATQYAKDDITTGTNQARGDVGNYGDLAQGILSHGTDLAADLVQGSNAMYAPQAGVGTAASNMLGGALGLNGQGGIDQARAAFTASPGYQFSVDQVTDAAARKAASLGMAASGNTLDAITRLGSNLANQEYGSWLDRLTGQSAQGLQAVNGMSNNNQAAANFRYGGGSALSSLIAGQGRTLGTLDTTLGTNLGNLETNRAAGQVSNIQHGLDVVNNNTLGAAQSQDRTDSANNGIFSKFLLGGAGPGGGGGLLGGLFSGFKL